MVPHTCCSPGNWAQLTVPLTFFCGSNGCRTLPPFNVKKFFLLSTAEQALRLGLLAQYDDGPIRGQVVLVHLTHPSGHCFSPAHHTSSAHFAPWEVHLRGHICALRANFELCVLLFELTQCEAMKGSCHSEGVTPLHLSAHATGVTGTGFRSWAHAEFLLAD